MTTKTNAWIRGLGAAVITGFATSGLSALGIEVAEAAGLQVQQLDVKQFISLATSGAVVGLLAYLKQSPLPPAE